MDIVRRINLDGAWDLRWTDGQRGGTVQRLLGGDADMRAAIPARVPGEVHLDLIKAGLIAEPCEGLGALSARWVEEHIWQYRRTFTAARPAGGERAFLQFDALDLAAVVYLNGQEAGRHANAFYPCVLDVTPLLVDGENVLVVALEAGLYSVADKPSAGYGMSSDSPLVKRHWLRQTQSQAGWDWSPRLLNVGIRGSVWLEFCRAVRVTGSAVLADIAPGSGQGTVTARVFMQGLGDPARAVLQAAVRGTSCRAEQPTEISPGEQTIEVKIDVPNPNLWWPIGHGEQALYDIDLALDVDGVPAWQAARRVGFRHIQIKEDALEGQDGSTFAIEVNGKPLFCKGANLVPADLIIARIDAARYQMLVERALEANFNFLRVWGGGVYESDDFYQMCSERGILVWQEFIFACCKYPAHDPAFLEDVQREATYQMRRLAHHASLAVWCGNNEMELGSYEWGFEQGVAYPDYALFHMVLPRLVAREDGTRPYRPSSPMSPDVTVSPNADNQGDQHPWSVGFVNTDFRDYRRMACRFPNEGGLLGPTALPTVRACLPPGHQQPLSFAWETHDNSIAFWGAQSSPDAMLGQWLGKSLREMTLEDYVYWAGLLQGEGLREYIDNFRRRRPLSASAVFWMYNDCWPAVRSWTVVDYYGRRTPAFWPVRRAFAPVHVVVAEEGADIGVYGINDTSDLVRARLRYGVLALAGEYPIHRTAEVELAPNASQCIALLTRKEWAAADGQHTRSAAFASLEQNGRLLARGRLLLPFYKDISWPECAVKVAVRGQEAVFTSDTFAWGVCLDLDGEDALGDNFFDVWPGTEYVIPWKRGDKPRILRVGNLR